MLLSCMALLNANVLEVQPVLFCSCSHSGATHQSVASSQKFRYTVSCGYFSRCYCTSFAAESVCAPDTGMCSFSNFDYALVTSDKRYVLTGIT